MLVPHYEALIKPRNIVSWLANHPRFVIPLLLAFLVALLVSVFNPIRIFFIEQGMEHSWYPNMDSLPSWLTIPTWVRRLYWKPWFRSFSSSAKSSTSSSSSSSSSSDPFFMGINKDPSPLSYQEEFMSFFSRALPDHEWHRIHQLKKNLYLPPGALVYITGPIGSGKTSLAEWITTTEEHRAKLLKIDFHALIHQARSSMDVVRHLAKQIGYMPFFHSLDRYWGYLDTALSASFGARTGISMSEESTLQNVLDCATMALVNVSKKRKEHEPYPVVILDHFLMQKHGLPISQFYDQLSLWAGRLVELGIAHVIVLSNSNAESEVIRSLSQVLSTKPMDVITLKDMPNEDAKLYLQHHLPLLTETQLDVAVKTLGGRTHDLDMLIQKTQRMPMEEALNEMVQQAMVEMYKYGFELHGACVWTLLPLLPTTYASLVNTLPCFQASFFTQLESNGLIDILYHQGRPSFITFPKPLYQAAFQTYLKDPLFSTEMEIQRLQYVLQLEKEKVQTYLKEYIQISSKSVTPGSGVQARITYLNQLIASSQQKIEAFSEQLKKNLQTHSQKSLSV